MTLLQTANNSTPEAMDLGLLVVTRRIADQILPCLAEGDRQAIDLAQKYLGFVESELDQPAE